MQKYHSNLQLRTGLAISGATVRVFDAGTVNLATLYEDNESTAKANPLSTDSNGEFSFKAADGDYDIVVDAGVGYEAKTITEVHLEDYKTTASSDLADTADAALGDALIGGKKTLANAVAFTLHGFNEKRWVDVCVDYGATGNGATDDTTAIQAAINAVGAAGGGTVFFPEGLYRTTAALTVRDHNVRLLGEGYQRTIFTKDDSAEHKYLLVNDDNADSAGWNTGQSNTLASNAVFGSTTITLSAGKGANLTTGTWAILISDAVVPGSGVTNKQAEFIYVFGKATDVITLGRPLRYTYNTADNGEVRNIDKFLTGFEVDGIGFDGASYAYGSSVNDGNVIEAFWCYKPVIRNMAAWELPNTCVNLMQSYGAVIHNLHVRDTMSDGFLGFADGFGYAVVEQGLNEGLSATQINCDGARHAYTTSERSSQLGYGVPTGSVIGDSVSQNCRGAGFDTHPPGSDITFVNCTAIGSMHHGFQARSVRTKFVGCLARDCVGAGMNISSDARNTYVGDFTAIRTNRGTAASVDWTERGAIYDDGERSIVDGFLTEDTGGPGYQTGPGGDFNRYRNGVVRNPAQLAATNTFGYAAGDDGPTRWDHENIHVEDTGAQVTTAFRTAATLAALTQGLYVNISASGYSTALANRGVTPVSIIRSGGIFGLSMGTRHDGITIATGALDLANANSPYISVNGEGAAADNLDTINGGLEGAIIVLERGDADITVRDSSVGGGNVELAGAVSFVLNGTNDCIVLRCKSNTWREISRADV